jgi:hypothetical protein
LDRVLDFNLSPAGIALERVPRVKLGSRRDGADGVVDTLFDLLHPDDFRIPGSISHRMASLVPVVSHLRISLMGLAPFADAWKISTFAHSRCRQNPFLCPADNSDLVFVKWCVFDYAFFIQWSIGFLKK